MARIAFLGTPEVAAQALRQLRRAGHEVAVAVTAPDRRRGRGSQLSPSPVKRAALELGIAVVTKPADLLAFEVELGVVVAFGQLIRGEVLERVPLVNVHFSLLPRWRGAAPVERAILAGDRVTGACLMAVEAGFDTGPVYACEPTEIGAEETAGELRARLGTIGTRLLVDRLAGGLQTLGDPVEQSGEVTWADKIDPEELRIDWRESAVRIDRVVRLGRAWTTWRDRRLLVLRARPGELAVSERTPPEPPPAGASPAEPGRSAIQEDAGLPPGMLAGGLVLTGAGWLELLEVQAEGRAPQPFSSWARGARAKDGDVLGG